MEERKREGEGLEGARHLQTGSKETLNLYA